MARPRLRAALAALVALTATSVVAFTGGPLGDLVGGQAGDQAGDQVSPPTVHDLHETTGPLQAARVAPLHVVALGDSVPSGAACGCDPFPVLYGRLLAGRTGTQVTVDDEGVNGLDTAGLVDQLRQPAVAGPVSRADVVLVTIGANDFSDHHDDVTGGTCGDTGDCVDDELASMRSGLRASLARVLALRAGRPTTVLVTGYWNVFEDGDVAIGSSGTSGLQASVDLTRRVNGVISAVARSAGTTYVDLFPAFQSDGRDITSLLADDGDHPDAAGHAVIARTLLAAGRPLAS